MRRLIVVGALVFALVLSGGVAGQVAAKGGGKDKGGKVHKAWPHKKSGKKPHKRLARKLAKQIGPIKIKKRRGTSAGLTLREASTLRAEGAGGLGVVGTTGTTGENKLLLVRSFDIPKDDKLYADLSNYSWTYDNALATLGFVADKDRAQARQLLDQLAVLQNKSGSFQFAFDVASGASSEVVRSGAVAWVGLAGAAWADKYGDKTYDAMVAGTIDYLLSRRNSAGLITGGPDVSWVSTQHNLLAAELLREAEALTRAGNKFGSYTATTLSAARKTLETAIEKNLLVSGGLLGANYFREGQNDPRIPIDVQALGAMYLESRDDARAGLVGNYMLQSGWYVAPRSTTAASTKVSGLKPFLDSGAPDLIWSEGTIEAQMALTRLGAPLTYVAGSVASLAATNKPNTVGPIGSDRTSDTTWGQYRTWPTSAAASWLLMLELQNAVYLFEG